VKFLVKIFSNLQKYCNNWNIFLGGCWGWGLADENDFQACTSQLLMAYLEGKPPNFFFAPFLGKTFNLHSTSRYTEGNQQTSRAWEQKESHSICCEKLCSENSHTLSSFCLNNKHSLITSAKQCQKTPHYWFVFIDIVTAFIINLSWQDWTRTLRISTCNYTPYPG